MGFARLGLIFLAVIISTGLALGQEEEEDYGSGLSDNLLEFGSDNDTELSLSANETDQETDIGTEEEQGSGTPDRDAQCWDRKYGHPDVRFADGTDWSYCSQESPDTWREQDLSISIECEAEYAILNYDLSKMASVNWLENVPVTISMYDKILVKSVQAITDFAETSAKVEGFCPGVDHKICIEFNNGGEPSNSFCKVCLELYHLLNTLCTFTTC